jgi:Uma2 family endonuclease
MAMSAMPKPTLISVDVYLADEQDAQVRHEYVAGRVYAMAGAKNRHNRIAMNFTGSLLGRLRGKPCSVFNSDTKVRIQTASSTSFYYPDGMVVRKNNPADDTFQDHPVVIAEVLSESTRRIDESEKRDAFLSIPDLKVCLLIEPESPRVTLYRRGDQGFGIDVVEGLNASIDLSEIDVTLPIAELYDDVEFESGDS